MAGRQIENALLDDMPPRSALALGSLHDEDHRLCNIHSGMCLVFSNTVNLGFNADRVDCQFERTVKKSQDPGNYFVTALAPAISAEGQEAVSHFVYMMNNPLQRSKMMLFLLDRLAGSTKWRNDHNAFYAVEIKETFDTR